MDWSSELDNYASSDAMGQNDFTAGASGTWRADGNLVLVRYPDHKKWQAAPGICWLAKTV